MNYAAIPIVVPPGCNPGDVITVNGPAGTFPVQVPAGCYPGMQILVNPPPQQYPQNYGAPPPSQHYSAPEQYPPPQNYGALPPQQYPPQIYPTPIPVVDKRAATETRAIDDDLEKAIAASEEFHVHAQCKCIL
jgi:predicted component of type VI protein secretion system